MLSRRETNRVNLSDAIPLKCPMLVHIDPCDCCNLKCKFCFHQHDRTEKGLMKMKMFKKIIDGLAELGRPKTIALYKAGEVMLHPDIVDMVSIASKITDKVWIKTNGLLLTPEKAEELANTGLTVLTISIIAPDGDRYEELCGQWVDYLWLRNRVMNIYNAIRGKTWLHVKMADAGFGTEGIAKFKKTFIDCDDIDVEYLHQPSLKTNYDYTLGNTKEVGTHGEALIKKEVCPLPFYCLNFERTGAVTVCSNDHEGKTQVGNMYMQTVKEVWEGQELADFRRLHLTGERKSNVACESCDYLEMLPDNIDANKQGIYEMLYNKGV